MSRHQELAVVSLAVVGLRFALVTLLVAGAVGLVGFVRRRRRNRPDPGSALDLGRMLLVGLASGLTVQAALELAGSELGGPTKAAVDDLLRRASASGLAAALAETEGILDVLAAHLARAQVTGAPVFDAVAAFVERAESEERSRRLRKAKTLPIRLIVPVSLLLLPGFLLLVMGPAIGDQLADLTGVFSP